MSLLLGGAAHAEGAGDGRRVVLEPVVVEGTAEEDVSVRFQEAVQSGLASAGLAVAVAAPAGAKPGVSCADAKCFTELAAAQKARFVVQVKVTADERDYELYLRLVDGESGAELAARTEYCDVCSLPDVNTMLAAQTQELVAQLPEDGPAVAQLTVESQPPGAAVIVDGEHRGVTPYRGELPVGPHRVELSLEGHEPSARDTTVGEGGASESFTLVAIPVEPTGPSPLFIAGVSGIGVGVASIIAGAVLVGIDENPYKRECEGMNVDADGDCRQRYNTDGGGIAAIVIGVLLAGGGAGLVYYDRKKRARQNDRRARLDVGFGPRGVSLRGRF